MRAVSCAAGWETLCCCTIIVVFLTAREVASARGHAAAVDAAVPPERVEPKQLQKRPIVFDILNPPPWTMFTTPEAQAALDAVVDSVGKQGVAIKLDVVRVLNSNGASAVQKALMIKKSDARKKMPSKWVSIKNFRCYAVGSKLPLIYLTLQMQRQAHAGAPPSLAWRVRVEVQPSVFTAAGKFWLFLSHTSSQTCFP